MASLYDGLGGEELQPSGLQAGGVNISPYFTGSITTASTVVCAGITNSAGFQGTTYSGTNANFTNVVASTAVSGASTLTGNLTAGSIVSTGDVISNSKALAAAGTGSPTTWGAIAQAGSGVTGGGSNVWVSFGTAFGAAPFVVVSNAKTNEAGPLVTMGSITAGSFYVETTSASQTFTWLAIGNEA